MVEFDPAPSTGGNEQTPRWQDGTDTFGRVYDVLIGLSDRTPYTEIADLADCSPNAAKKHLDRLVEMGVARADPRSQPASYARNEGYLEYQEASRIARDLTVEEIVERVRELEAERDTYEAEFDTSDPATVTVYDRDDHEAVHERMAAISDWQGIIRDIRLYELAHQLAQNDGHLIPA